jgi:glutamine synthetase type III
MLNRAKTLQPVFDEYCTTHQYLYFKLDQEEWRQIEYLLLITKPFFDFTNVLSKTRDVTVHHVFSIYNRLFNHLDDAEKKLKRKGVPWKKRML